MSEMSPPLAGERECTVRVSEAVWYAATLIAQDRGCTIEEVLSDAIAMFAGYQAAATIDQEVLHMLDTLNALCEQVSQKHLAGGS